MKTRKFLKSLIALPILAPFVNLKAEANNLANEETYYKEVINVFNFLELKRFFNLDRESLDLTYMQSDYGNGIALYKTDTYKPISIDTLRIDKDCFDISFDKYNKIYTIKPAARSNLINEIRIKCTNHPNSKLFFIRTSPTMSQFTNLATKKLAVSVNLYFI